MPKPVIADEPAKKAAKKREPTRVAGKGQDRQMARTPYKFRGEVADQIEKINKTFEAKVLRNASRLPQFNHISTGCFMLDFALMGGLPQGLGAMYYGWESSGKTTMALKAIAEAQRKFDFLGEDQIVAFVDVESTFDPVWAEINGVDTGRLLLSQPDSGEQAVDIVDALAYSKEVGMIVLDSIPALVPQKLIEESAEDAHVALVARLTGRLCSKLSQSFLTERKRGHHCTFLSINQFRMKIGGFVLGDPRVLPGGMQSNYFHTTKVEMKNKEKMGKDKRGFDVVELNEHGFNIKKAKIGNSIRNGEFQMIANPDNPLGQGTIDEAPTIAEYMKKFGLVEGKAVSKSTGKGSGLYVAAWDERFSSPAALVDRIRNDEEFNLWSRQQIVMIQREERNLPPVPKDGWLMGAIVGE